MLTLTNSGKRFHDDCTALPAGWTPVTAGGGTIVQAGSEITFTYSAADADVAFIVRDDALDLSDTMVVRTRSKFTAMATNARHSAGLSVYDAAAKPVAAFVGNYRPQITLYRSLAGVYYWYTAWAATATATTPSLINTYYCQEAQWDGTDLYMRHWSDAYAAIVHSQTQLAYAYTNSAWLTIGDHSTGTTYRGVHVTDYIQAMESLEITVTGLPTGASARLYNAAGGILASAVAVAGTATLDLAGVVGFDTNTNPDTTSGGFAGEIRVFADPVYGVFLDSLSTNFWGGDSYAYTASTPIYTTPPLSERLKVGIKIFDKAGTKLLGHFPYNKMVLADEMMGLESTTIPEGYGTATFTVNRARPFDYYRELEDSNILRINHGPLLVWEGDTEGVQRTDEGLEVQCLGLVAKLRQLGPDADLTYNLDPGEKLSTYIVDHVLTDARLGLVAGNIETTDFAITTGIEVFPGKSWWDILDEGNAFNGWRFWVGPGGTLNYEPRRTAIDFLADLSKSTEKSLDRNRSGVCNWVQYAWTGDGSVYGYVTSEDTASQAIHGVRCRWETVPGKCTQAEAQQIADVDIALHSKLKPSSGITTDLVYTAKRQLVPVTCVPAGYVLRIPDLLSLAETMADTDAINEICTWEMAETTTKYDTGTIKLSPGTQPTELDSVLARIDNRSRY